MPEPRKIRPANSPLRVGFVVSGALTRDSLFVNEQHQSALFYLMAFLQTPGIGEVGLIHSGGPPQLPVELSLEGIAIVAAADAPGRYDVVITEGGIIERAQLSAIKSRGAKLACFKRRSPVLQSIEWTVASKEAERAERYYDYDLYDEVWMVEELMATSRKWAETIYRCKVRAVPRLWTPRLLSLAHPVTKASFGFKTAPKIWRVGVAQSNNSVADTFHIPALVCNAAYVKRPADFEAVYLANTLDLASSHHTASFMEFLPIVKKRKMTVEPWLLPLDLMSQHCDVLVSHVWGDVAPTWYFEALFGNYPLVHDCAHLKDIGYYYPEFDVKAGADALLTAFRHHRADDAGKCNGKFLRGLDPSESEVQATLHNMVSALSKSS